MKRLLVTFLPLFIALLLLGPVQAQQQSYPDPNPQFYDVTYKVLPAENCTQGCYRLQSVSIVPDVGTFMRGWVQGGNTTLWTGGWPEGKSVLPSGDNFIFGRGACFFSPEGGPHYAHAGTDPTKSDILYNMGMPVCHHREFYIAWYWQPASAPTATPTATRTATPSPSPTPAAPIPFDEWLAGANDAIQAIQLNADAALQKIAFDLDLVPTSEEEWSEFCGLTCFIVAHQRFENLDTGEVWDCWAIVPQWEEATCEARD